MVRIPTHRSATHPGEMLLEEFLKPMGITQRDLAKAINVPYQRVNEIINGKRGITPSTALRLSKAFGNTADFWMNLQLRRDLYSAMKSEQKVLNKIKPMHSLCGSFSPPLPEAATDILSTDGVLRRRGLIRFCVR